jgi:hypothetical protein
MLTSFMALSSRCYASAFWSRGPDHSISDLALYFMTSPAQETHRVARFH